MNKLQFDNEFHVYDLNLAEIFKSLQNAVRDARILEAGLTADELLIRWESVIRDYCEINQIDFDDTMANSNLIISGDDSFYVMTMVMKLFTLDTFKIPLFLNYQKSLSTNISEFVGKVEYYVLKSLKNNSPFKDTDSKLEKITEWVLSEKRKTKVEVPKETEFSSLFTQKRFADDLIRILTNHFIINEGIWEGKTSAKTEVNYLISLLIDKGYLKAGDFTKTSKVFCKQFKIALSARSYRHIPKLDTEIKKLYQKILPDQGR